MNLIHFTCPKCAERVLYSYEELITRSREALSLLPRHLPEDIQTEVLRLIFDKFLETIRTTEKKEKTCDGDNACASLHELGHLMARRGYSIEDVLEKFTVLEDVLWDYLASCIEKEMPESGSRNWIAEFLEEHGGCHYKIKLFFKEITASIARSYVKELENMVLEKEEELQSKEMEISLQIMKSLLPHRTLSMPGCEMAGRIVAAKSIGGDFWDFYQTGSDTLEIVQADVMGHGVSAALLVAMIKYLFISYYGQRISMKRIVEKINNAVVRDTPEDLFITYLYCKIELGQGSFSFVSAGHKPPILIRKGRIREYDCTDMPLGLIPGSIYHIHRMRLKNNDILVFVSDGVTDARSLGGEFFGDARLKEVFSKISSDQPAQSICDYVIESVIRFCAPKKCRDDITAVVLKINEM